MLKYLYRYNTQIIVFIILCAVFARFLKIEYLPYADDGDEMAYIFAGQSLLTQGVPISWSSFTNSARTPVSYEMLSYPVEPKTDFHFVQPWFDHMYFVPLLMGSWSLAWGYDFPSVPPALVYRLPMLLVSLAVLYLVYTITQKHFGTLAGIFSLLVLGFSPGLILIHRMVVAENFLNLFFLLTYYFYIQKKPLYYLIIGSFLAAAVKVTGLAIIPIITFFFIFEKQYKRAAIYFLTSLALAFAGYALYGALIDWQAFVTTLEQQSYRLLGWSNPAFIFSHPGFHIYTMLDMSYYLIPMLALGLWYGEDTKVAKQLATVCIALFTLIWITSAEQDMLGWYKIPLFSFLTIAAGAVIAYQKYYLAIILLCITLVNNLGLIRYPTHPLPDTFILRGVVAVVIGFSVLYLFYSKKVKMHGYFLGLLCVLYIIQGLYVTNAMYAARCKDRICPIPLVTVRSTVERFAKSL